MLKEVLKKYNFSEIEGTYSFYRVVLEDDRYSEIAYTSSSDVEDIEVLAEELGLSGVVDVNITRYVIDFSENQDESESIDEELANIISKLWDEEVFQENCNYLSSDAFKLMIGSDEYL